MDKCTFCKDAAKTDEWSCKHNCIDCGSCVECDEEALNDENHKDLVNSERI